MCGIAGIVNFRHNHVPINKNLLNKMVLLLSHRGPDEDGFYINSDMGFGMRRLTIIDLETGHQPISNEDNTIWVIFNGEIYNYRQLSDELKSKGHIFKTKCDTEVIVHAYEEYGEKFIEKLNGMFAIALWDNRNKLFYLIRDRLGIKPQYYCIQNNKLYFSSELKSLLLIPGLNKELDRDALDLYLTLRYIPSPFSIFKNIKKLEPATFLKLTDSEIHKKKYWDLKNFIYQNKNQENYEIFEELLEDSIRLRLHSDVPLGVFLSGGLDSSSIVSYASKLKPHINTFSMGFEVDKNSNDFDELKYARIISKKFNTTHHEFILKPSLVDILPHLIWHLDEPLADPAILPTYYLSKMTKEYVTVCLSGEGGDELFGGYEKYKYEKVLWMINKYIPFNHQIYNFCFKKKNSFDLLQMEDTERWINWDRVFSPNDLNKLYSNFFHMNNSNIFLQKISGVCNLNYSYFENLNAVDFLYWLPDDLLMKVDKMSMSCSLEVRVPLLDHRIVELLVQTPNNKKMRVFTQKYLLKKVMKHKLPKTIINRKKHGFSLPVDEWLRKELKDFTKEIMFNASTVHNGIFNGRYITNLLENHSSGKQNFGRKIWTLLIFEIWYRRFVENETF